MANLRHHKLCYLSSYDRGLDKLLFMWEDIKKKYPDAELHVAYGWNNFDKLAANNPERMEWKSKMVELMKQDGVIHYGRVNKDKLNEIMDTCGILAYSTDFFEISCLTVLHCQKHGCVPVVGNKLYKLPNDDVIRNALDENVYAGVKVSGDIKALDAQKQYLDALFTLMDNPDIWRKLSREGKQGYQKFKVEKMAEKWGSVFMEKNSEPLVSIITPTIRKGFWNLMAQNISNQTYKNVQWIVVDDYKEHREDVMKRYCKLHDLVNFKYVRGGKTNKYEFGLSTANNLGWKNSDGELLVWLQDFMIMPPNGIESLVDLYRRFPNTLIAPTDINCKPSISPNVESEDWFNGKTNVVGELVFDNIRNKKLGIRYTDNPADWEVNYGAVPKSVVDDLGGWYDFFNDGLGFDNTEFAYRALLGGYKLLIDDTNQAVGINHWDALKDHQDQLGTGRTHKLNDPRYIWMQQKIKEGKLSFKRDERHDGIKLDYQIPKELTPDGAVKYVWDNMDTIVKSWENII